jgi:hypothetical protein
MASFSSILENMIRGRIGAPAPSGTRQATPSAAAEPAVRNGQIESGHDRLLPADKIAAVLCSYTPKQCRARGRRVLISAVAAMANLSRETVYLARRGIMSQRTRMLLSRAISSIEHGEVMFRRCGQQWEAKYRQASPAYATPQRTLDFDDSPAAIIERINNYGRPPKTVPVDLGGLIVNVCTGW